MGTGGAGTTACPFGHPRTTRTFRVPKSIDRTGTSNAARALNAFIAKVPNGSVIDFARPGAVYRLDAGLLLSGRRNIVLLGHGSTTLRMHGSGHDEALSTFLLRGSSHVRIRGFNVAGSHKDWPANVGERAHVLALSGWYASGPSHFVELSHVTASRIFGDGVYLEGENEGDKRPSTRVCIHDNTFDYVGRNGISLINVTDVLVKHNKFDHVGYHAIDIEPNFASEEVRRIRIRDNVFGSYSHRSGYLGFFVADAQVGAGVGATVAGITIANNRVGGIAANGYNGTPLGLDSKFLGSSGRTTRRSHSPGTGRPAPSPAEGSSTAPGSTASPWHATSSRWPRARSSFGPTARTSRRAPSPADGERVPSRQGQRATAASSCWTWMQRSGSS